ncbi:MAG: hypothetical protein ACXWHZ_03690 [Usitatibacter sp.]
MTTYTFHTDPGHGWLAVPTAELRALHIVDKISGYSYLSRDGKTAYLEEDCDLSTFAEAKGWKRLPEDVPSMHSNRDSFIRDLPGYHPINV